MNALPGSVLVVDDDEIARLSYLRSLMATDCTVEAVSDGIKALREMERHPFYVVMLDLRLPGLAGMSILRTIKERWPESEVVVTTGYPSIVTAKDAVRFGAYAYLAKPVGPDEVIKAIKGAMLQKKWSLHSDPSRHDRAIGPSPAMVLTPMKRGPRLRACPASCANLFRPK